MKQRKWYEVRLLLDGEHFASTIGPDKAEAERELIQYVGEETAGLPISGEVTIEVRRCPPGRHR